MTNYGFLWEIRAVSARPYRVHVISLNYNLFNSNPTTIRNKLFSRGERGGYLAITWNSSFTYSSIMPETAMTKSANQARMVENRD